MCELTFCTTNLTKLAHARYIAEGRNISIKGFRQRTYHADYEEPRLTSRTEILEISYRNAARQVERAGFSLQSHAFILEDTSVRIDALSSAETEVPGVDIKYWMQGQTFETLDAALRAVGNVRTATVRSDVVLHVPRALKEAWKVHDYQDYVVFVGEQVGQIVEHEADFASNLVFPWLDNKSFNRWFKPNGCALPLGALPIDQANQVDFRRRSFEQLFDFLEQRRYLNGTTKQHGSGATKQLALPLKAKVAKCPNLIVCGFTCAGKTTASQHLARKFGYLHVEASDFMHLSYYRRHGFKGEVAIADFAEEALRQKPNIAAEKVEEYILQHPSQPIIISGFRSPAEVAHVMKAFSPRDLQFETIFVESSASTRFSRLKDRSRPGDVHDMADLLSRDEQQVRMGLESIAALAQVVGNEVGFEEYLAIFEALIPDASSEEWSIDEAILAMRALTEVTLQDAILIALLSVWREDEARLFHTTTEIAGLIARVFTLKSPKHKDNVSRYFNQDFYAYYEIGSSGRSSVRRYRLSNTGYGMAVKRLRSLRDEQGREKKQ